METLLEIQNHFVDLPCGYLVAGATVLVGVVTLLIWKMKTRREPETPKYV